MLSIDIIKEDLERFNQETIERILDLLSLKDTPYKVTSPKRANGKYITIKNESDHDSIIYVIYSSRVSETAGKNGRNSYFVQSVSPPLLSYKKDDTKNKSIYLYLFDPDTNNANTNYQNVFYRIMKTLGVNILNECELKNPDIQPYNTISDFLRTRSSMAKANNQPTYVIDEGDSYTVFGKTFGANERESVLITCMLRSLNPYKSITIFPVRDNEHERFTKPSIDLMSIFNIKFGETIFENTKDEKEFKTSRNQLSFKFNLSKKYGEAKCYLCDCDIPGTIIASHIHRVADINKDNTIDNPTKYFQAADGNNGLWLCSTHDKLFEYGTIYFENGTGKLLINPKPKLQKHQIDYIDNITLTKLIDSSLLNASMLEYIEKHCLRVL